MANLPSIAGYMTDAEIQGDAPVTEQLLKKSGQSNNYLLDHMASAEAQLALFTNIGFTAFNGPLTQASTGDVNLFTFTSRGRPIMLYWLNGAMRVGNGGGGSTIKFKRNGTTIYQSSNPGTGFNHTINLNYANNVFDPANVNPFFAYNPGAKIEQVITAPPGNPTLETKVGPMLLYFENPPASTAIAYNLEIVGGGQPPGAYPELVLCNYLLIY